jgi:hypothetical protein
MSERSEALAEEHEALLPRLLNLLVQRKVITATEVRDIVRDAGEQLRFEHDATKQRAGITLKAYARQIEVWSEGLR